MAPVSHEEPGLLRAVAAAPRVSVPCACVLPVGHRPQAPTLAGWLSGQTLPTTFFPFSLLFFFLLPFTFFFFFNFNNAQQQRGKRMFVNGAHICAFPWGLAG